MVEVRTHQQHREMSGQQKARAMRLKLVHENSTPATIQVYAGSEELHALLKHPGGMRMRGAFGTPTEWPYDNFTHRRLLDGSVSIKPVKERHKDDPKLGVRENAAKRRPKPEDLPPVVPMSVKSAQSNHQPQHQPQPKQPVA